MRIWVTPRAMLLHVVVALVVPGFLGLAWWQLNRALSGNSLSWAYTFEWPFFAGYALFVWWKMVHDQPGAPDAQARTAAHHADRPVGWALAPGPGRRRSHQAEGAGSATSSTPAALPGDALPGDVMAGDVMAGDVMAGDVMAGDMGAGDVMAGDMVAGDMGAGDVVAGAEAVLGTGRDGWEAGTMVRPETGAIETGTIVQPETGTIVQPGTGSGRTTADIGTAEQPGTAPAAQTEGPGPTGEPDDEDAALAEYNRYLAALNDSGRRKTW
ncbi:MAG: hypothetical protein M0Z63_07675 [Actinomycetota bacterium]|nr:hypothetical protein [Actinomycetota bacterium]